MESRKVEVRRSNIELLRIVAMLMIVIHHIIVHGIYPCVNDGTPLFLRILDSFVIYGVNIFVLISGYFGIRLTWKSFFNLMLVIGFYKIFNLCIDTFMLGYEHSVFEWVAKPLSGPVSGGGWFVDVYVLLMLISPLLNKMLHALSKKEHLSGLLILLLLDTGYGFLLGKHFDSSGYGLLHFIVLYYIGMASDIFYP